MSGRAEKASLAYKTKYAARQAAGLCGLCGLNPPVEGRKCCSLCMDKQNAKRAAKRGPVVPKVPFDKPYHQRNKELGVCALGGINHDRPKDGHVLCDECREKKRLRYEARKRAGLCKHCNNPVSDGRRKCDECRRKQQEARVNAKAAGLCPECAKVPTGGSLCESCIEKSRVSNKRCRKRLRLEALNAYGGPCCVCCYESCVDLLELDHINNDGNAHRRELFGINACGSRIYRELKKLGYPAGLQVLCSNCNKAKHRCGVCPHTTLSLEALESLRSFNRTFAREYDAVSI